MVDSKQDEPSYEELAAKVEEQWQGIAELHKTIKKQDTAIAELHAVVNGSRRKSKAGANYGLTPTALGVRVEAILRLAEKEVEALLEEARQQAAEIIAQAEQEAAALRGGVRAAADGAQSED